MSPKTDKDQFDSDPAVQSTPAARLGMDADKKTLIMEGWAALVKGDNAGALSRFEAALSADRSSLEAQYGQVWDTDQLGGDFDLMGFLAP